MSGKALLILVVGFTLIFIIAGYFWGSLATRSVDNHVSYYKNTIAHNIAVSGANIALAEISQDSTWMESSTFTKDFENGVMNVEIPALGPIVRTIKSTGTFMGVDQIVKVKWMRDQASLAKYAWFIPSVSTGSPQQRPWITGDSIWGGFQSNQFTVVGGDPVFFGKVSDLKGIKELSSGSNPQFLGGYQTGVQVSWVSSMHYPDYATLAGPSASYSKDLWLKFNSDGTVTYRVGATNNAGQDSTKYGAPNTVDVSTFAPNGVVYVDKANVYMSGVLNMSNVSNNNSIIIVAEGSSGSGGPGNVYLTGDMIYHIDPMIPNGAGGYMVNPASLDANNKPIDELGIIATNDIVVSTSNAGTLGGYENNVENKDIQIDGAIFCNSGGFRAENLGSTTLGTDVPMGSIYLQGSMTAGQEGIVALFDGSTLTAGYNRHVIFDERFATSPPKFFPYITYYRVISWLE